MSLSTDLLATPPIDEDLRIAPSDDAALVLKLLKSRHPDEVLVHGATAGTLKVTDTAGATLLASSAVVVETDHSLTVTFKTTAFSLGTSPSTPIGKWWLTLTDGTKNHLTFAGRVYGVEGPPAA